MSMEEQRSKELMGVWTLVTNALPYLSWAFVQEKETSTLFKLLFFMSQLQLNLILTNITVQVIEFEGSLKLCLVIKINYKKYFWITIQQSLSRVRRKRSGHLWADVTGSSLTSGRGRAGRKVSLRSYIKLKPRGMSQSQQHTGMAAGNRKRIQAELFQATAERQERIQHMQGTGEHSDWLEVSEPERPVGYILLGLVSYATATHPHLRDGGKQ